MSLLAPLAEQALIKSDIVVGYKAYLKLVSSLIDSDKMVSFNMRQEKKRAEFAINKAKEGLSVCLVSGGDAGVYGMAGVVLEAMRNNSAKEFSFEIIPGITALSAAASLLGAPLTHDFAVISLSDLLTDLALIEKRIKLASQADFVIVFYNPKSRKRIKPFQRAGEILLKYKNPMTPVGIVRNAYRKDAVIELTDIENMLYSNNIDMFSTVIIGNSQTYVSGSKIITPRGYKNFY